MSPSATPVGEASRWSDAAVSLTFRGGPRGQSVCGATVSEGEALRWSVVGVEMEFVLLVLCLWNISNTETEGPRSNPQDPQYSGSGPILPHVCRTPPPRQRLISYRKPFGLYL